MTTFEPFQKVLVRESVDEVWQADLYSHCDEGLHYILGHPPINEDEFLSYFLIPYNDETKHLLGTTDSLAPTWEPKPGELVAVRQNDKTSWRPRVFAYRKGKYFVCQHEEFHNVKDDGWHYCEPLRNHFKIPEE